MNGMEWPPEPRLPYKTRWVQAQGGEVEEYIIPENEKEAILGTLYCFDPVPSLADMRFDLHEEKLFKVGDFRVVRDADMNMLVSPYFFQSGGTVIDWMPPDVKPGQIVRRKIRGKSGGIMETMYFGPMKRFAH